MSQLQLWNLSESGLWKWSHCCSGEVLLFLDFPTFPKESPRSSHSSLGAAASLLSLPAVALAVLHPSSPFPARSLGHHSGMWVFQTLAVPLCWSGLWECSTEVFQEGQGGAGWLCLPSRSYLPFPSTPFLAGAELLSSGHLPVGNLF